MENRLRLQLLGVSSCMALLAPSAMAQAPRHARESTGLTEIVVTAQKRSQRLQDVPIAITAINQATLQANRIQNVTDLSGVAPNVTVRESGGSIGIPAFGIRGVISYGVVPGSDKETSIYIDGVYIGSPEGSDFQLPDIQQIEVLRGPQGTLFGRNATAGAISITTRDPDGKLGGEQDITVGNYKQFRTRTSVNLPAVGPVSAYFSYVHNQRNGDIRNLGAGTEFDRSGPNTGQSGIETSPKTLGGHDGDTYFAAVKYEPTDWLKAVYKFDYSEDYFTPEGSAAIAVNPAGLGPAGGGYLDLILAYNAGNYLLDPSARRPEAVNNSFSTTDYQKSYGHNLTTTAQVNDQITLKNILAYRYAYIYSNNQIDGLGGLNLQNVPAAYGGGANEPFAMLIINSQTGNRQFSDEQQMNYNSRWLTLTSGAIFFHQNTVSGAPPGMANNFILTGFPGGRVPLGNWSTAFNHATSIAAYSQAEVHVTSQVDLVAGVRVTDDKKSGTYVFGGTFTPGANNNYAAGTFSGLQYANFHYQQTKPAWSLGVNYKPTHDTLLYAKYSDSFVSGGAVSTFSYAPETASSFEVGGKADFFQHRLRTNLSLFDVEYRNIQAAQSGTAVAGAENLGTLIVDLGNANAKGAEFEVTARPIDPITLGGSLGYTNIYYTGLTDIIKESFDGAYVPTLIPKFTVDLNGQYETDPLWHGARLIARVDADWHTKERTLQAYVLDTPGFSVMEYIPAAWNVNARVALADIDLGGHTMEIAGWAKNLFNSRIPSFPDNFGSFALATTFVAARTYGIDLNLRF